MECHFLLQELEMPSFLCDGSTLFRANCPFDISKAEGFLQIDFNWLLPTALKCHLEFFRIIPAGSPFTASTAILH